MESGQAELSMEKYEGHPLGKYCKILKLILNEDKPQTLNRGRCWMERLKNIVFKDKY